MKTMTCAVVRTICGGAAICLILIGVAVHADATYKTHYVWTDSPFPGAPYNAWTNAAHDIQTAVDFASAGDTVLVTNGLYTSSGDGTNLVYINTTDVTLKSVNGAEATILDGGGTNRCIFAWQTGIIVDGFTLTNGISCSKYKFAGGIFMRARGIIRHCIISGNQSGSVGGGGVRMGYDTDGSQAGVIEHCLISGNTSSGDGGGIHMHSRSICTLQFCRVENNVSARIGGARLSTEPCFSTASLSETRVIPRAQALSLVAAAASIW